MSLTSIPINDPYILLAIVLAAPRGDDCVRIFKGFLGCKAFARIALIPTVMEKVMDNCVRIIRDNMPYGLTWGLPNGWAHRGDDEPSFIANPRMNLVAGWYKYDMLHRVKGPAMIYGDGRVEYWIGGKQFYPSLNNNQNPD